MNPRIRRPHSAVIPVLLAFALALAAVLLVPSAGSAATNLVSNGTFETGSLAGWSCSAGSGAAVSGSSTTWPTLRGAMTWSTNWDALNGNAFSNQVGSHVHSLP